MAAAVIVLCATRSLIDNDLRDTCRSALGRLVLYDLLILRRSASAAFARKRDIFLLLLVVPVGLLLAIQRVGDAAAALGALHIGIKMAAAAATALVVNFAIGRRLTHLREESVVARHALRTSAAMFHALFWNLLPLCGLAVIIAVSERQLVAGGGIL